MISRPVSNRICWINPKNAFNDVHRSRNMWNRLKLFNLEQISRRSGKMNHRPADRLFPPVVAAGSTPSSANLLFLPALTIFLPLLTTSNILDNLGFFCISFSFSYGKPHLALSSLTQLFLFCKNIFIVHEKFKQTTKVQTFRNTLL